MELLLLILKVLKLVMNTAEKHGFYIDLEFFTRMQVVGELDSADLYDLAAQLYRELVENFGLGGHGLVPLKVDYYVWHVPHPFIR